MVQPDAGTRRAASKQTEKRDFQIDCRYGSLFTPRANARSVPPAGRAIVAALVEGRADPATMAAWLTLDGFASLWCGYAAVSAGAVALHMRFARPHRPAPYVLT
jgi:hypothetical protein